MSRAPENPLELLKSMSRIVTPAGTDALEAERRHRVSGRVDDLLEGLRARDRRRRGRWLWALGAAAALVLAVGAGWSRFARSPADPPGAVKIRALSGDVMLVRAGHSSSASSAPNGVLGA